MRPSVISLHRGKQTIVCVDQRPMHPQLYVYRYNTYLKAAGKWIIEQTIYRCLYVYSRMYIRYLLPGAVKIDVRVRAQLQKLILIKANQYLCFASSFVHRAYRSRATDTGSPLA